MEKVAYFRELKHTNQCELVFPFKYKQAKVTAVEEIHAVRRSTDNVQSLLEHIQNKIKKMLEDKRLPHLEISVALTKQGKAIPGDVECKNLINSYQNVQFAICHNTFKVVMNAPLVQSINLPVMLYVDYVLQPTKFKSLYTDKKASQFIWYSSSDKLVWQDVGYTFKYKPSITDLNKYLKLRCVPKNLNSTGPTFDVMSESMVQYISSIPTCPFLKRHELTQTMLKGNNFRVVSYNVLSYLYSETNTHFPYCSPQALSIDYRKQLILKELIGYNADIMCLQEVDQPVFSTYYMPKLGKKYKSVMNRKGNRIPEGLVCFYNKARFQLLQAKHIVFSAEISQNTLFRRRWNFIKQNDALKNCILKQPTSLQVVILDSKECNEIVIVANTHLYYHADADDIRLLQASIALDYIQHISKQYQNKNSQRVSVIFCGDFNSVPTSGVYKFISQGELEHTFNVEEGDSIKNINLKHPFQFVSACGVPKYTNYTGGFKGCLDYIFYERNSFTVTDSIPLPEEEVLSENIALPSELFPSDHIALVADLKWF